MTSTRSSRRPSSRSRQPRFLYNHKVVEIGQDDSKAWVQVETPTGSQTHEADYIVGCDGANSKIRRCLFGESVYPGHTWEEQIVATNTYYDFEPYGYDDSQFFITRSTGTWWLKFRLTAYTALPTGRSAG